MVSFLTCWWGLRKRPRPAPGMVEGRTHSCGWEEGGAERKETRAVDKSLSTLVLLVCSRWWVGVEEEEEEDGKEEGARPPRA